MDEFLNKVIAQIVNPLIYFIFALAIAFFLWGVLEFLMNQENDEKRTTGKQHMLWGIIGIAIMMSVFILMNLILNTFGIDEVMIDSQGHSTVKIDSSSRSANWLK